MLTALLSDIHPLNAKKRAAEIAELLKTYIPGVEKMQGQLKKYATAFKQMKAEVDSGKLTMKEQMELAQKLSEYEDLRKIVDNIPEEILTEYTKQTTKNTEEKRL